jgi:hypothetical protein
VSTLEEVQAASRRMDAAKKALLAYIEEPHEHADPKRQRLIESVRKADEEFFKVLLELGR